MKKTSNIRKLLYSASTWGYGAVGVTGTFMAWINDVDDKETWLNGRPVVSMLIQKLQDISPYIYIILGLVLVACWIIKRLGDPWVVEKIQFILDQYRNQVFGNNGTPHDHERVTIFQHRKYCFNMSHWSRKSWYKPSKPHHILGSFLVPYLRSGHLSQNTKTCFYAPDDSDKSEGVASLAWARKQMVIQDNLPSVSQNSSLTNKERYANRTNCPIDMINSYISSGKALPRSIAATILEKNGKLWGVLVLDSRDPHGVSAQDINNYKLTIALIGQLLERA